MAGLDSRAFVRRALVVASYPSNNLAHPPTADFQAEPPDYLTHALASSSPPRVSYLPWALLGKGHTLRLIPHWTMLKLYLSQRAAYYFGDVRKASSRRRKH